MALLERWIVASKMVPVFDKEILSQILAMGGSVGGGWSEVHQHVHVTPENKETIEELLVRNGYKVLSVNDPSIARPGSGRYPARPGSGRFAPVRDDHNSAGSPRPPSGRYPVRSVSGRFSPVRDTTPTDPDKK